VARTGDTNGVAAGLALIAREGRIGRALIVLLAFGFAALVAAGVAAAWVTGQNQTHADAVAHTYEVELTIGDARRLLEQAETTRRGYMLNPGYAEFRNASEASDHRYEAVRRRLGALTRDNPAQRANLVRLDAQVAETRAVRREAIAAVAGGDAAAAVAAFRRDTGLRRMMRVRTTFDAMREAERRLLLVRDRELQRSTQLFYTVLTIAGVLLLLVAFVTLLTVLRYTRDLQTSRDILQQLNDSLEEIVAERTADLSRANEEIQRFAYIVSHDLRSPLVNVMGFTAELDAATGTIRALIDRAEVEAPAILTDDARLAAREDLPEAIGFIRTSTQKMDRLINAILQLSRQGRRVLAPEPVDVAKVVDGIRASLQHRLDDEGASVAVAGELPELVTDRLALEQILSNLIENAVKYRHPDRPVSVTVSGGRDGARAWLAVADTGRGIDARDHERVFDLFRRSGQQDQPGEGIGLAHVRALAYRLGGTIDLRSTLGAGATFRVSLPATLLQEPSK
jgi:signal transduction histidine kinase